jgi:spermidine synthase
MNDFIETLYDDWGQRFVIDEVLFEEKTEHQHLLIFRHGRFGRVMALDGVVQTTERDEFIYHEMLAHVPMLAHGAAESVLIIGGGDGGMLREVCKHRSLRRVTQVEIDPTVVEMSKRYLPNHSAGAYDDPRLDLVFADGADYVRTTADRFDVVMVDSTDPIGPGGVLFTPAFYAACARCMNPGGILVTQNGVAYMQPDEAKSTGAAFAKSFADWTFYGAAVPTYVGGMMLFGWASSSAAPRETALRTLRARFRRSRIKTRYYTPAVHQASFALPRYVLDNIGLP